MQLTKRCKMLWILTVARKLKAEGITLISNWPDKISNIGVSQKPEYDDPTADKCDLTRCTGLIGHPQVKPRSIIS